METEFIAENGLWPRIECEFSLDDLLLAIHALEQLSFSFPHGQIDPTSGPVLRFWEERVPTLAFFFAHTWTGALFGESGYFDGLSKDEQNDAFKKLQGLDPSGKAAVYAEKLRAHGDVERRFNRRLTSRQVGPGVTETEVLMAALHLASAASPRADELVHRFAAAVDQLEPVTYSETETALIEAASKIKHCGDYGHLWWHADTQAAYWEAGDGDDPERGCTSEAEIEALLAAIPGVAEVQVEPEHAPCPHWIEGDGNCMGWVRLPAAPIVVDFSPLA